MDLVKQFLQENNIKLIVSEHVQPAREDTVFLLKNIHVTNKDKVLEIGVGCGLGTVFIGRKAKFYYGNDINFQAVKNARDNCERNGVKNITIQVGDCFEPFTNEKFDVIFSSPPQLPTPGYVNEEEWVEQANNSGPDGRFLIDRIIQNVDMHLNPEGKLYLEHLSLSNIDKTLKVLKEKNFNARITNKMAKVMGTVSSARRDYIESILAGVIKSVDGQYVYELAIIQATKDE